MGIATPVSSTTASVTVGTQSQARISEQTSVLSHVMVTRARYVEEATSYRYTRTQPFLKPTPMTSPTIPLKAATPTTAHMGVQWYTGKPS